MLVTLLIKRPLVFKELLSREGQDTVVDASHEERVRQYSRVSLDRELVEKNWCSLVPQLLESSEHDFREKVGSIDICI